MAQQIITQVTSDLSGEAEASTVTFGYAGYDYEIDLTEAEAEKLAGLLSGYIEAGRRLGRGARRGTARKVAPVKGETEKVRAWARENGFEVNERGRIPNNVQQAFQDAHS